jgi:hypothetical protein
MTKRSKGLSFDDKMRNDDDDNGSRGGNVYFCGAEDDGLRWPSSAVCPDAYYAFATRRIFVFCFSQHFSYFIGGSGLDGESGGEIIQAAEAFLLQLSHDDQRKKYDEDDGGIYRREVFLDPRECSYMARVFSTFCWASEEEIGFCEIFQAHWKQKQHA